MTYIATYYQNYRESISSICPHLQHFDQKEQYARASNHVNPCFVLTASVWMYGTLLVLSTYCTMLFSSHNRQWLKELLQYTDREYSTYCTRWKTYAHTLICLWHKKIINFGNAPTLFMTFARATRKNHQNLSKLLCGNTSNSRREHTHRHKNVQYTDSQSLSWHCWLG